MTQLSLFGFDPAPPPPKARRGRPRASAPPVAAPPVVDASPPVAEPPVIEEPPVVDAPPVEEPIVFLGDCVEVMAGLPEGSVGAVVCDPPYGIEFMNKTWDRLDDLGVGQFRSTSPKVDRSNYNNEKYGSRPSYNASQNARCRKCRHWRFSGTPCTCDVPDFPSIRNAQAVTMQSWHLRWVSEAFRVLQPGGVLKAFVATRTFHRLAAAMAQAGFVDIGLEAWCYGSGFPKSRDISKEIDKMDKIGPMDARARQFTAWMRSTGITSRQINEATGTQMGNHYLTHPTQPHVATAELFDKLRPLLPPVPQEIEDLVKSRTIESENLKRREVVEKRRDNGGRSVPYLKANENQGHDYNITAPHTPEAQRWQGWGTALKPAWEPCLIGRKP